MTEVEKMLLPLMEEALKTPFGISVRTNNPERARGPFYKLRRDFAPLFDELTYRKLENTDEEFYIVRRANEKGDDPPVSG